MVLDYRLSIDYLNIGMMLEARFDRNVGSGDGYLFVGYLTLLVKKKERRGRRLSVATEEALGSWTLPKR